MKYHIRNAVVTMQIEHDELLRRRKAARRTAWILALVALLIFSLFIFTGVTGRV
jgi:hypothetical protein